jgi:hypothetical protein
MSSLCQKRTLLVIEANVRETGGGVLGQYKLALVGGRFDEVITCE